jgi:aryl-alcohol dehydrogenase-like predicted oxidoreductase
VVRSGKVLYPAVSNYSAWQTQAALGHQERAGWARLQAIQPMYSLVKRQAEVELLPMAQANGIGVVAYSPSGGGLLSGRYTQPGAQGRHTTNKMYKLRYGDEWMHQTAAKFVAFCKERGWHPISAAVAWVRAHPAITAPIIGGRSLDQLRASLDAVKITMTPELRAEIGALSRTPPPATDRSDEAAKP